MTRSKSCLADGAFLDVGGGDAQGAFLPHEDGSEKTITIGTLAQMTGVSTRSLRYYEEQGLLVPNRSSTGHRRYDAGAERCVRYVQQLFHAGLTTRIIRELRGRMHNPAERDQMLSVLNERLSAMTRARDELTAEVDRLTDIIDSLSPSPVDLHTDVNS